MIQKVKILRGQTLTREKIARILISARSTYDYARFDLWNGKYIVINFTRDNKYEIATNSRDYNIVYDIKVVKATRQFSSLTGFVYKWLPKLSK